MNQNVFQDTLDNLPSSSRLRIRALILVSACMIGVAAWSVFYIATEGFTRGTLEEVTSFEKQALDDMHASGIVVRDAALPCSSDPHVVVQVNWNSQLGGYCVSMIGLQNVPFESVLPFISRFAGLREINAPYLSDVERVRIARLVPSLLVSELAAR